MTTPTPSPAGYRLRTPENWADYSVADETSENLVADDVWTQCMQAGLSEKDAGEWTESVRRSIRRARQSGVLHAAGVFEIYEDGPFVATVAVSALTPPESGDVLEALLGAQGVAQPDGTWNQVSAASIEGIGTVGRVQGIQDVTYEEATVRCAVMHTVVPIPGVSSVLVVTGSSPNIDAAAEVFELFDTISRTFEFTSA